MGVMMNVNSVNGTNTNTLANQSASQSNKALSSDFTTFLKMLTTQMQNQDPLNPIESTDFAIQLATFSGVEQQVKGNEILSQLGQQLSFLGLSQLSGWAGKDIITSAPVQFSGGVIELALNVPSNVTNANISVRNHAGVEVQRFEVPSGANSFDWVGLGADGQIIPSGTYNLVLETTSLGGQISETKVESFQRVSQAKLENGTTVLVLANGQTISANQVIGLRAPD
jgi:flagellar basal-body rod modification protein FlgD